jgi:hypothetical protein
MLKRLLVLVTVSVLALPSMVSAQTAPVIRPTTQDLKAATSGNKDWLT